MGKRDSRPAAVFYIGFLFRRFAWHLARQLRTQRKYKYNTNTIIYYSHIQVETYCTRPFTVGRNLNLSGKENVMLHLNEGVHPSPRVSSVGVNYFVFKSSSNRPYFFFFFFRRPHTAHRAERAERCCTGQTREIFYPDTVPYRIP